LDDGFLVPVLENFPDAVVLADADDRVVFANRAAARLLGWTVESLVGQLLATIQPERLRVAHQRAFARFMRTDNLPDMTRGLRVPVRRRDGTEVDVEMMLGWVPGTGGARFVIAAMRSLAEREALHLPESLPHYLRALNEAASNLSSLLDQQHVLQTVVDALVENLEAAAAQIWLYDPADFSLHLRAAASDFDHAAERLGHRLHAATFPAWLDEVASTRRTLLQSGLEHDHRFDIRWIREERIASLAAFPLVVGDQLRGVLAYFSRRTLRQELVEALRALVSMVTLSLRDADLFLRESEARSRAESAESTLRAIIRSSPVPIIRTDTHGRVTSWNPAAHLTLGWAENEVLGQLPPFVGPDDRHQFDEIIRRVMRWESPTGVEMRRQRKDGSWIDLSLSAAPLFDSQGHITAVMAVLVDITERKQAEAALEHRALHDPLTDLPNRALLFDRLQIAIASAARENSCFALCVMDLDRFKEVNDTCGHEVGDQLLQEVARRLRSLLRESDTVARLGGDEFAILLPGADEEGAALTATKVRQALVFGEGDCLQVPTVSSSIGCSCFPRDGTDTGELLRKADKAMYVAKRDGGGFHVYQSSLDSAVPA
jgi:diguanylate cyclase (GGDEF)-like protein/PAS domain S-box-containing protein